jgi:NAD(P)-dependent dehydrogenase (short-subunit alcohol dehydrogenase family)
MSLEGKTFQVAAAIAQAVERFGGVDVCVNNASAINLSGTLKRSANRGRLTELGILYKWIPT